MHLRRLLPIAFLSLILPACGGSTDTATTGGASDLVNGCDEANAVDMTQSKTVAIAFGGNLGSKYSPACVKVLAGTTVTFNGNFAAHPLQPGTVGADGSKHPATDPVLNKTTTGMSAPFTFTAAGAHPFYCDFHADAGMKGDIIVK